MEKMSLSRKTCAIYILLVIVNGTLSLPVPKPKYPRAISAHANNKIFYPKIKGDPEIHFEADESVKENVQLLQNSQQIPIIDIYNDRIYFRGKHPNNII